jgi:MFS family permease
MKKVSDEEQGRATSIRHVAFASFIGTAIEWYDFFIYGTAAALLFPKLFFPDFSPLAGTLASFGTFGVGFFTRPVGAVVFGHFGDKVGRKSMLVITLVLMGVATFLIGLLPTFAYAGIFAPILLVALRLVQGFAVGGEWGGATLMTVEHAPETSRNFYASWPQLGPATATILSAAVFAVFSSLPDEQFFNWGWRVPFLLSIVLIGVGLFIRLRVVESPAFIQVKERGSESRVPLLDVLRHYPIAVTLAIGVSLVNAGGFYLITTFAISYLTTLGVPRSVPLLGTLLAGIVNIPAILISARIADRAGKRPVAIGGAAGLFLFSYPYFWLIDTRSPAMIWLAMSTWLALAGMLYGIQGVFIAELFPARVRYSGISFGHQIAGMLGGAFAPLVATGLIKWSGGTSWPVATYLAVMSLLSLIAVYLTSDRYRVHIHGQHPVVHRAAGGQG